MYKKMYLTLFNAITDALEHIDADSPLLQKFLLLHSKRPRKFTSRRRMTLTEGCTLWHLFFLCGLFAVFHCWSLRGHTFCMNRKYAKNHKRGGDCVFPAPLKPHP